MSAIIPFKIENGKVDRKDKLVIGQEIKRFEDGEYEFQIKPRGKRNATRYKFYFDAILGFALPEAKKYYQLIENGEQRQIRNVAELHDIMKMLFNPVTIINQETGELLTHAGSTTKMSDRDFIGQFSEEVMAHFASPPFNVEFVDYQEWGQLYGEGNWYQIKAMATTEL